MKKINFKYWIAQGCCLFALLIGLSMIYTGFHWEEYQEAIAQEREHEQILKAVKSNVKDAIKEINNNSIYGHIHDAQYEAFGDNYRVTLDVSSSDIDMFLLEILATVGPTCNGLVVKHTEYKGFLGWNSEEHTYWLK